jgi:hypothetical protein
VQVALEVAHALVIAEQRGRFWKQDQLCDAFRADVRRQHDFVVCANVEQLAFGARDLSAGADMERRGPRGATEGIGSRRLAPYLRSAQQRVPVE